MVLDRELAFFRNSRQKWIADGKEGKWVAIHDESLLDFYDSLDAAYKAGVEAWGNVAFLAKQVRSSEPVETLQRLVSIRAR